MIGDVKLVRSSAHHFFAVLKTDADPVRLGTAYGASAAKPLRLMSLLSANVRLYAIFFACIGGDPRLYWWFEVLPLTLILGIGISWHRAVEARLIQRRLKVSSIRANTTRSFQG